MASSCRSSPACVYRWHSMARRRIRRRPPSFDGEFGLEDLFREQLRWSEEEHVEEDVDDDLGYIEPLVFDEQMEADMVAKNAERLKREAEEKKREAEEKKRRDMELKRIDKKYRAVIKSIRKYDPKTNTVVWTRFPFGDFGSFDYDEESAYLPMRNTNVKDIQECTLLYSANILTIKIASSDVGFPIDVYGTAIARDNLDRKCVSLFRCHRRDSQLISSEDESLVLTGPTRGHGLLDFIFIEVDLKIKGAQGQDKQLSKGLLEIDGRVVTRLEKNEVTQVTLASWLSTVQVKYAVVKKAVEATVEIHFLWGYFNGQISAHTSSIPDEIVLYKGETGGVFTCDGGRIIPLWRRILTVCFTDKLIFTIENRDGTKLFIESSPGLNGSDCYECPFGSEKFRVKVTWSVI